LLKIPESFYFFPPTCQPYVAKNFLYLVVATFSHRHVEELEKSGEFQIVIFNRVLMGVLICGWVLMLLNYHQ